MSRRIKYSYELRKEILRKYFEDKRSMSSLSKEYGIEKGILNTWRAMYLLHGDEGIKPINNKYSGKFKEEVLEYFYSHNMQLRGTAIHFKIPSKSIIRKWQKIYEQEGILGLYEEKRGRALKKQSSKQSNITSKHPKEIQDLSYEETLKELEYLRIENECLKKYHALLRQKGLLKGNK